MPDSLIVLSFENEMTPTITVQILLHVQCLSGTASQNVNASGFSKTTLPLIIRSQSFLLKRSIESGEATFIAGVNSFKYMRRFKSSPTYFMCKYVP